LHLELVVALGLVSVNRPDAAKVAWHVLFWVRTTISMRDERQPVFMKIGFVV
jgi:hypothetical protein